MPNRPLPPNRPMPPKPNMQRRTLARALKAQGLSYSEVGKALGVTSARASDIITPRHLAHRIRMSKPARCEQCGTTDAILSLHHSDYSEAPDTLLCLSCHKKLHHAQANA